MFDDIRDAIGVWLLYWTLCFFPKRSQLLLGPKVLVFFDEMKEFDNVQ